MTNLIRGIDFQVVDDPDPDFEQLILSSAVGQHPVNPEIWDIFDDFIEEAVREGGGLVGGLEPFCEAMEEYCKSKGITHFPPLYQYIFDARGGFLTQSKAIHYLRDAWIKLFPSWPIRVGTNEEFDDFHTKYIKDTYQRLEYRL
jgi:hypothetical protein